MVTEGFEFLDVVAREAVGVEAREEVSAEIVIVGARGEHMVGGRELGVGQCAAGALLPAARGQAIELGAHLRALGVGGGLGDLGQRAAQPAGPLGRGAAHALAGALVIARRHPGPRGQVGG